MGRNRSGMDFIVPGQEQAAVRERQAEDGAETPDFSRMTKQQIKRYDDTVGSYRRLLGDQPITLLWLLNHYSKPNVAAYQAQKAAKKKPKERKAAAEDGTERTAEKQFQKPPRPGPEKLFKNIPGREPDADEEDRQSHNERGERQPEERRQEDIQPEKPTPNQEQPKRENFGSTQFVQPDRDFYAVRTDSGAEAAAYSHSQGRKEQTAYLKRVKTGEKIWITRFPFRLGRDPMCSDYAVEGNTNVSARHAMVGISDGVYYIEDAGSTNGVMINGTKIETGDLIELVDDTLIELADEKFIFRL